MGVHGLWQLLHSAGKPVSPASLDGKVLAVDVSIWLHQTMKGMREKDGSPLPNAHLQGLFSRICKLLFYRIRPIFVFDGGVPVLKKQTLAGRRERKEAVDKQKGRTTEKLLQNLLHLHAVKGALGKNFESEIIPQRPREPDLFQLPPLPEEDRGSADPIEGVAAWEAELEEEEEQFSRFQMGLYPNLSDVDFESAEFASLPAELRHELLTEMKEQRKEDALARFIDMPKDAEDFSSFQLKNLIKQNKLTRKLESIRKEMNAKTSGDIAYALGDDYYGEVVEARRVVSEDAAHYILIKGLTKQQQLQEAVKCVAKSGGDHSDKKSQLDISEKAAASRKRVKFQGEEHALKTSEEIIIEEARKSKPVLSSSDDDDSLPKKCKKGKGGKVRGKRVIKGKGKGRWSKKVSSDESESDADPLENNLSRLVPSTTVSASLEDAEFTCLERASPREIQGSGASSPQDGDGEEVATVGNADQTDGRALEDERRRLIFEEEELARAKEEKMAALMQSLERRNILSVTPPEEDQTNSLPRDCNSAAKGKNVHEQKVCSLQQNESRQTLVSSKDDNVSQLSKATMVDEDAVASLSEPAVIGSHRKPNPSSNTAKSTSEEFLEDVALAEKKAATKNARSKVFGKFPSLTVAYLEDLESEEADSVGNGKRTRGTAYSNSDKPAGDKSNMENKAIIGLVASSVETASVEQNDRQAVFRRRETHGDEHTCKKIKTDEKRNAETNFESRHPEENSDDGFIEITFNPLSAKEDDLFPANIFTTSLREADTPVIHKNAEVGSDSCIVKAVFSSDEYDSVDINKAGEENKHEREQGSYTKAETTMITTDATEGVKDLEVTMQDKVKDISEMQLQMEDREITDPAFRGVETVMDLYDLHKELSSDRRTLTHEQGKQTRLTTSISDQINREAQELLQLFGVPFVVSPMEAEAQCAFLEMAGLTEGTITDDSDIWLFGATKVYKNFFNQTKYVELYSADAIRQKFGLDREKLINIALLCGSDYTEGIPGVGPVRAMEIMAEFPGDGMLGLKDFREWWERSQKSGLWHGPSKAESKLCNLKLHEGFPCQQVVDAYLKPTVDDSEESFSWGEPDLDLLRQFAKHKFGWNRQKSDDTLLPMMKEYTKKMTQGRISSYFHPENFLKPATVSSKRLQNALNKFLCNERSSESETSSESSADSTDHLELPATSFPEPGEGVIEKANKILQRTSVHRGKSGGRASRGNARAKTGRSDSNQSKRGAGRGQKVLIQSRVMLKDEVSLSETSSSEEENSKKSAKRKNPKVDPQVSKAKTIKMDTSRKQARVGGICPSTKSVVSAAASRGVPRMLQKKAVSLGPDLNPDILTIDDLGSDFSEEDFH